MKMVMGPGGAHSPVTAENRQMEDDLGMAVATRTVDEIHPDDEIEADEATNTNPAIKRRYASAS